MRARVFTLRLDADRRGLDDSELTAFFEEHDALSVAHHPLLVDGEPALAVVVTWRGPARSDRAAAPRGCRGRRAAPIHLSEPDRALFEVLRSWRNERARRDGRPAYVLFNNDQLAEQQQHRLSPLQLTTSGPTAAASQPRITVLGSVPGS